MSALNKTVKTMGTLPVFMTAVSTILGAILFLRFGFSIAHVGLLSTLAIILIGHMVTIPTAMAVAEIATNQKVEGGGAYYIISRSFGFNIGGSIGIALFLAQGISIAFYVIAFGEACKGGLHYLEVQEGITIPVQVVNFGIMALLAALILTRGANIGVKALYGVVALIAVALLFFFMGESNYEPGSPTDTLRDFGGSTESFYTVFAIIFPAFTGIAAGLGLSGDLKEPRKSIPRGTLWATVVGIVIYIAVSIKLYYSASPEKLGDMDRMVMQDIAIWGPIIPIGLAAAAISSALGSIMIAPRTLQALGNDDVIPFQKVNDWIKQGRDKDNEPINASLITVGIAFAFLTLGDINAVAEIISMFFMVTYGAICLISFFEHFAADPSYRPTFRSRWYVSLLGAALCFWLMFKMNTGYAYAAILSMGGIYIWLSSKKGSEGGLANLFKGVIFQLSRSLQVFLQRKESEAVEDSWRPFILTISHNSFKRSSALKMTSWLSYKYGFGTYMHLLADNWKEGARQTTEAVRNRLLALSRGVRNKVYIDTLVVEDYRQAISLGLQMKNISGKPNNMMMFEFSKDNLPEIEFLVRQYHLFKGSGVDICVLRSSEREFGYCKNLDIWITTTDFENSNLMILLGYITLGHPDWKKAEIRIFSVYEKDDLQEKKERLTNLIESGRLPISRSNIELIQVMPGESYKTVINERSVDADLTIIGFDDPDVNQNGLDTFNGYPGLGNILFVNAHDEKVIR